MAGYDRNLMTRASPIPLHITRHQRSMSRAPRRLDRARPGDQRLCLLRERRGWPPRRAAMTGGVTRSGDSGYYDVGRFILHVVGCTRVADSDIPTVFQPRPVFSE